MQSFFSKQAPTFSRAWQAVQAFGVRHRERDLALVLLAMLMGVFGGLLSVGLGLVVERGSQWLGGRVMGLNSRYVLLALVFAPAIGGLVTGLLQSFFLKDGPSNGVPDVIYSMARLRGRIPGRKGFLRFMTTSSTLVSGGSAGLEGSAITIGSWLGSQVMQKLGVAQKHGPALIGCGAAATMAGIFHTPIAGVLFVLEVLLRDFSIKTFMPIVIASVMGTAMSQALLGTAPLDALFVVPEVLGNTQTSLLEMPFFALAGILCGVIGYMFCAMMRKSEALWVKLPVPIFIRPALGGLALGVLGVIWLQYTHHEHANWPDFMGNGYHVIEGFLDGSRFGGKPLLAVGLSLVLLLGLKMVATCCTLGSGGAGGVIAPGLLLGAIVGLLVGLVAQIFFPDTSPGIYALAAMAGVIAAMLHCPLTAFLLVFELTHNYQTILPAMLVAILATLIAQKFHPESAYSYKLNKLGIAHGQWADMTLLRRLQVRDVPLLPAVKVRPLEPATRIPELAATTNLHDFITVDEEGRYLGMVLDEDIRTSLLQYEALPFMIIEELMRRDLPTLAPEDSLEHVMSIFAEHDVACLVVLADGAEVQGVLSHKRLLERYGQALAEKA